MKLIATHVNADFDGFAAMLGLLKLHPEARLCFPGSKEPLLRSFLEQTGLDLPEVSVKDASPVEHLILVDASREERLGPLAALLHQQPRPLVEIYDHHRSEDGMIVADRPHLRLTGSTTTIVVLQLMKTASFKPLPLTTLEASILLAGIYEDTAGFSSSGTVAEDFQAALYLVQQGAEVRIVSRFLSHQLQPDQAAFFSALVSHCEEIEILHNRVCLTAFAWPEFVAEAAYLVHRLMDVQPYDIFFALILMEHRVHLIARSQVPDVDVGHLTSLVGGGGHPMAASAVMKGVTLIEAKEKVLAVLRENLKRRETAADLMKTGVISILSDKTIGEAADLMNSFRINALPVMEANQVIGTISRQIVDGAVFAGLQGRPVGEYMSADVPLVDPDTPASELPDRMVSGRTRFVLVGKHAGDIAGIITRMDLLRYHHEISPKAVALKKGKTSENLHAMMRKRLPEAVFRLLVEAGETADRLGLRIYLVGGMVRDLLLHRENMDVDLVVEGDGLRFAREFGKAHGCEVAAHQRFGTAQLLFPNGFKMDVASARTESYQAPAALPDVRGGILRQDLYRRDFTINTLAIDLLPPDFGKLVDYFGGWDDLHQGMIRVLHSLSFIDDPTRTLRAVRFAVRFNFRISDDTKRLLRSAVESRVLEKLSGKRFWNELQNILEEEHPIPAIRMLASYKLLSFVHPQAVLDSFTLDLLDQIQDVLSWFHMDFPKEEVSGWLLYLMALLEKVDGQARQQTAASFQLTANYQQMLQNYKSAIRDIHARLAGQQVRPSTLYFSLHEFPTEVLLYAMARLQEEPVRSQLVTYLRDLRSARLAINGDDLLQMGLPKGPRIKEVLDQVLAARLDGAAIDRQQQLQAAQQLIHP